MFFIIGLGFITAFTFNVYKNRSVEEEYLKEKRESSAYTPKMNSNMEKISKFKAKKATSATYGSLANQSHQTNGSRNDVKTYVVIDGRLMDNSNQWQVPHSYSTSSQ